MALVARGRLPPALPAGLCVSGIQPPLSGGLQYVPLHSTPAERVRPRLPGQLLQLARAEASLPLQQPEEPPYLRDGDLWPRGQPHDGEDDGQPERASTVRRG